MPPAQWLARDASATARAHHGQLPAHVGQHRHPCGDRRLRLLARTLRVGELSAADSGSGRRHTLHQCGCGHLTGCRHAVHAVGGAWATRRGQVRRGDGAPHVQRQERRRAQALARVHARRTGRVARHAERRVRPVRDGQGEARAAHGLGRPAVRRQRHGGDRRLGGERWPYSWRSKDRRWLPSQRIRRQPLLSQEDQEWRRDSQVHQPLLHVDAQRVHVGGDAPPRRQCA